MHECKQGGERIKLFLILQTFIFVASLLAGSAKVDTYVITGYAPLDSQAKAGMCFQGNPNITASGAKTKPGITLAGPPEIPFGTWVWIEGAGLKRVEDRGKAIKGKRFDICFLTRQAALNWGRKKAKVIFIKSPKIFTTL